MKSSWILIVDAIYLQSSVVLFADISIVKDNQAEAVIAIDSGAPWVDRHAAEELSNFVEDMTGTRLKI